MISADPGLDLADSVVNYYDSAGLPSNDSSLILPSKYWF